jgi:hypothetical protein
LEGQEDSLVFFSIIVSQNVKSGQAEGIPFPLGFNGASRDLVSLLIWVWIWIGFGFGLGLDLNLSFSLVLDLSLSLGSGLDSDLDSDWRVKLINFLKT